VGRYSSSRVSSAEEICGYPGRTQSSVYPVPRIVDEDVEWSREEQVRPDVTWFSTIAVNDDLVKAGDEKVYGATCLDCDFVRYELVNVSISRVVDKV
jgi:hypothetical protein